MNDYEKFLYGCYCAVVKIKRFTNDLYNFIVLMEKVGLKEYAEDFERNCCDMRSREEKSKKPYCREEDFCEDYFFHLAEINGVKGNVVCIEFQWGKGFTFGSLEDYQAEEVKILSVEDLINATGYESEFGSNYKMTSFLEELKEDKDNKLATYLTDFCEWYQWGLVKYPNGRYNILDLEFDNDEFVGYFGNENTDTGTLKDCIERVFYRMVDYYTDEEDYERVEDMEKDINDFIELGKKYNLFDDNDIKRLKEWLEEEKEYFKEEE